MRDAKHDETNLPARDVELDLELRSRFGSPKVGLVVTFIELRPVGRKKSDQNGEGRETRGGRRRDEERTILRPI